MNCEEFEAIGLDAERDASLSEVERVAAREHAGTCSRCAALQDSWQAAGIEIRSFAEDTILAQAPPRVEMRLRQEFRTQHVTLRVRRTAVVTAWALASAAVLAGAVSWRNWRHNQLRETASHMNSVPVASKSPESTRRIPMTPRFYACACSGARWARWACPLTKSGRTNGSRWICSLVTTDCHKRCGCRHNIRKQRVRKS